jgi:hypothetical protein
MATVVMETGSVNTISEMPTNNLLFCVGKTNYVTVAVKTP